MTDFLRVGQRGALVGSLLLVFSSCATMDDRRDEKDHRHRVVSVREDLESFDGLIPVSVDSVMGLYATLDPTTFRVTYDSLLCCASALIDSLNSTLAAGIRIDTLAIDHSIENFGNAARQRNTLFISSSYFFLYRDASILRSVIWHEFGHVYYELLPKHLRDSVCTIWNEVQSTALAYLFHDGEYSGNARFGGHPQESPSELFASAFNLLYNRPTEFTARLQFVDSVHVPLVDRLRQIVTGARTATE